MKVIDIIEPIILEKVKTSDTIELIKCMVEMKTGIPPSQQRLVCKLNLKNILNLSIIP